ncbi:MAG TPA: NAD-dependent epimerase/dehydratase family protein, partial [Hyphomicrobiaceae bacterium]|nr:NAD-dependent epimerase/dehydratase family protein [Hyphomicrobiaceae bacterium]
MAALNVGITGMIGFVGSHLRDRLLREEDVSIEPFEDSYFDRPEELKRFVSNSDVVVHLAAMNRGDPDELYRVNVELVTKLVSQLEQVQATPHVIFSSSTQCDLDNPYGRSKKQGARLLEEWARRHGAPLTVMIIPNVFGDRGLPYYNSVVATFCHQLAQGEEPQITGDKELNLIYIQELTEVIHDTIMDRPKGVDVMRVRPTAQAPVSRVLSLLQRFKQYYAEKRIVPVLANTFERNLYNTFLTYMEDADYEQHPPLHSDERGSLFEVVKQEEGGQVFFSTTKPGVTRGNHYHTRKMERFCVVQGEALIRLRRIGTDRV